MNYLVLNAKKFRILNAEPLQATDTPKGRLIDLGILDDNNQGKEWTKITYAYDYNNVGEFVVPTPIEDVVEYFYTVEEDGKVVSFGSDHTLVTRQATALEIPLLNEMISEERGKDVLKRRASFKLI